MRKLYATIIILLISHCSLLAQEADDSTKSDWAFSTAAYYYFLPDEDNTITVLGYADYKKLHLEARYGYEDQNSGSIFAGWRFEAGNKLALGVTPMLGGVFGDLDGFIPALELDLSYGKFDYYSETEYVVDVSGKENNFFYVWGELGFSPIETLRTGISYQKTRLYQTDREVQRGVFAQYSFWKVTAGLHYFNPFASDNFVIAVVSIDF